MKEHGVEIKKWSTLQGKSGFLLYMRIQTYAGIKNLIKEGESKTKQALRKIGI